MAPPAGGGEEVGASLEETAVLVEVRGLGAECGPGPGPDGLWRLQLSAEASRPGHFRLVLQGSGSPPGEGFQWSLESVACTSRGPRELELQPPQQGPGPGVLTLCFRDPQDAQRWGAVLEKARDLGGTAAASPAAAPAPGLLPPTVSTPPPASEAETLWSPQDFSEKEALTNRLTQAICGGDEQGAAQAAAALAQRQVPLNILLQESCFPPGPVRLQVTVEDAASSAHISLRVHPHSTIAALQEQVFKEYGFPPRVQRWVIGRCLCVPERSLASYGVQRDGDPAFLYLLSGPPGPHGARPSARGLDISKKSNGEISSLLVQQPGLPPASRPAPNPSGSLQVGWSCPSCTFINVPGRPGCEMCSTEQPAFQSPQSEAPVQQLPKITRRGEDMTIPPSIRSPDNSFHMLSEFS